MIHSVRDQRALRAFHMMNAPELSPARDHLADELHRTLDALVTADADHVPQLQGRAKVLREILELVREASAKCGGV